MQATNATFLALPAFKRRCGNDYESLYNVAPADVYYGWKDDMLARGKEAKQRTFQARREHNRALRELDKTSSTT